MVRPKRRARLRLWGVAALAITAIMAIGLAGMPTAGALVSSHRPAVTAGHTDHGVPAGFREGYVDHDGVRVHYVTGGQGPALLLLHGWPATWYSWAAVMPELARRYTVIAPDLTGLGASGIPAGDDGAYTALAVAEDMHAVVTGLGFRQAAVVGHDWGGNIAAAYAIRYRSEVRRLAVLEAGASSDFDALVRQQPDLFWFAWFQRVTKDDLPERLVAGRESVYYSWFYRNAADRPDAIGPATVARYVDAYRAPGRVHASFEYYRQSEAGSAAVDALLARDGKLAVPVLGVGGAHSFGDHVAAGLRRVAVDVTPVVIPDARHWVVEENPTVVLSTLEAFLAQ